ncbi:hypothetical protein [Xanthobacter autotrophicus]|uniref:hypothetical protein n=1 Tax=Xanthobacter autotrophicus TaxID=280 RepID=UPI003727C59C
MLQLNDGRDILRATEALLPQDEVQRAGHSSPPRHRRRRLHGPAQGGARGAAIRQFRQFLYEPLGALGERRHQAQGHLPQLRHLLKALAQRYQVGDEAREYILGHASADVHRKYGATDVILPGLAVEMEKIAPLGVP